MGMTPEELKRKRKERYDANAEELRRKRREYYYNNKEKSAEYSKQYHEVNRDKNLEVKKKYREANKEKIAESKKIWDTNNRDRINEYVTNRKKYDKLFKLSENYRCAINKAINRFGYTKKSKTTEILGCTFEEFKAYIESKFESWMNWSNHGLYNGDFNYGWDIDHIIPLATAKTEDDIIMLNHYTNLQPLCSHINRDIKKDNL
jgi:DNA helicase IV